MLKKNRKNKLSNVRAMLQLGLMIFLTIFTQMIMLLKTSVVASTFGVSVEMDAFNFANNIGTFVYSFIGSGITTVLIPNLINKDKKESVNIFLSILYSAGFIVLIIIHLFREYLVKGLSNGNDQFVLLTCNIMFITLITQYIISFTGATNAIFQCSGKFNFPKFVSLITSIILVVLVIFTNNLTIYKYCIYILITTIINVAIQIYLAIKGGYSFKFKIDFKNEELRAMLRVFAPTVLSTGLYQVSLLTDTIISSNLGEGEISKLSYSNNIMNLINTIILANIMTFFYPKIAKNINKDNEQQSFFDLSILINAIMILMVVGFCVVGKEGIIILYQRGRFTPSVTIVVYICTLIYMIGMPSNAFRDLIYRYFYAKGDTLTPFKNSLIISVLNIIISIILSKFIGIYGIIIGTVITSYMSLSMILFKLNKKFTIKYSKKKLVIENMKLILASIFTIAIVKAIRYIMPNFNVVFNCLIYGIICVGIYLFLVYIFKSKIFRVKLN